MREIYVTMLKREFMLIVWYSSNLYDVAMSCCIRVVLSWHSAKLLSYFKVMYWSVAAWREFLLWEYFVHFILKEFSSKSRTFPIFNSFDPEVKCSLINLIEIVHNSLLKRSIKKANELWFQKSVESCMTFYLLSNRDFS